MEHVINLIIEFKKWNSYVEQILKTQSLIFQAFHCINLDYCGLQLMNTQNSVKFEYFTWEFHFLNLIIEIINFPTIS